LSLLAATGVLVLTSPGFASVNLADPAMPASYAPRYCSGAFRYAARLGNADIVALAPAQVFANDRRLTRLLRRTRTGDDADSGIARLTAPTAMCG
jgi:hypothetical protein